MDPLVVEESIDICCISTYPSMYNMTLNCTVRTMGPTFISERHYIRTVGHKITWLQVCGTIIIRNIKVSVSKVISSTCEYNSGVLRDIKLVQWGLQEHQTSMSYISESDYEATVTCVCYL